MKVLMFGWEFPPHISGGLGTACYGLTKGLVSNGVEVTFVIPRVFGDEDTRGFRLINASDVELQFGDKETTSLFEKLEIIAINSILKPYLNPETFEQFLTSITEKERIETTRLYSQRYEFSGLYGENLFEEVSRYALVAASIAATHPHDIIHAHDWMTYPAGIAAKKVSGKPLVVHVHATEFDRSGQHINQAVYDIEKAGMEAADRVITVSNYTRQIVIERYGIDPAKVITVHNAVLPSVKKPDTSIRKPAKKIVTFLGRVTFQKGPEYFVEAAAMVIPHDPDVHFVMAGSGDMLRRMIKRVAHLRIGSRFHFTGFLKGQEVDTLFAMSDVYVMPSVSEPFGISPLEALRSNVPVIISRQSGVAEILHHAIIVDFWDIHALADAIYALLHYPALSRFFIKYGKKEVEQLQWENAAYKVKNIYLELIKSQH